MYVTISDPRRSDIDDEYAPEATALRERGIEAEREGGWAEAEERFRQAFEAGHPVAAHDLGLLLLKRGDDAGAEEWWRRAADLGVPQSAFEIGYLEEQRGNHAEAERWYRQAAGGGHRAGVLNLGVLLEARGAVDEAKELYRRAWEMGADQAAFNLGRLIDDDGKGDLVAAADWYGLAADRGNGGAAYNLGFVRQDQGDPAGRMEAWRRAAELKHPKAAFSLGVVLMDQGDEDAGIAWFRRAVQEFGDEKAARRVSDHYGRLGQPGKARFWREFPTGLSVYSPEFEAFASEGSAAAIHRQDVLNDFFGDGDIGFDMDEGTLTAGGRTFHGLTVLGSFSHLSKTWLWSWDNPNYDESLPAIAHLRTVRDFGQRHEIPELVSGRLDFSKFPDPYQAAKTMAVAAAALLGGNGVYACRINDGKGAAVVHVDDPRLPVADFDRLAAVRLLMTAVEVFPADHRRVVRGFLAHYGFEIRESPDVIEGRRSAEGRRLTAGFTTDGLLNRITSE